MTAIHEHRKLDHLRPAIIVERVEGRPDRPAGIEDIVHENDDFRLEIKREFGLAHLGIRTDLAQVVTVHRDIESPEGRFHAGDFEKFFLEPFGKEDATGPDANKSKGFDIFMMFENLVGHARKRAVDACGVKDKLFRRGHKSPRSNPSADKKNPCLCWQGRTLHS